MNGLIFATIATLLAVASAAPGIGYGYVSAGHHYGNAYVNPGVATVESHSAPHAYQYGLNEQGPHYHKTHHQTASFHHTVAVPVAHAVPVAAVAPVAVGYAEPAYAHHGYAHHGYAHQGLDLDYGHVY